LRGGAAESGPRAAAWLPGFEELLPLLEIVPTTVIDLQVELSDKDVPIEWVHSSERGI
jgi:hypothetical protein